MWKFYVVEYVINDLLPNSGMVQETADHSDR